MFRSFRLHWGEIGSVIKTLRWLTSTAWFPQRSDPYRTVSSHALRWHRLRSTLWARIQYKFWYSSRRFSSVFHRKVFYYLSMFHIVYYKISYTDYNENDNDNDYVIYGWYWWNSDKWIFKERCYNIAGTKQNLVSASMIVLLSLMISELEALQVLG